MFTKYKEICAEGALKTGQIMVYNLYEPPPKAIILFPTKFHWKDKSTTDIIELGLKSMIQDAVVLANVKSIAMPKLGCGLGGLNFEHEVQPLMEYYFKSSPLEIEIYI